MAKAPKTTKPKKKKDVNGQITDSVKKESVQDICNKPQGTCGCGKTKDPNGNCDGSHNN